MYDPNRKRTQLQMYEQAHRKNNDILQQAAWKQNQEKFIMYDPNRKRTQLQMYEQAHRKTNDILQQAAWMCGLLKDDIHGWASEPLTISEIQQNIARNKNYSWAFQTILGRHDISKLDPDKPLPTAGGNHP